MKVCITGATGFLGNNLARKLIAEGYSVKAYVRESSNYQTIKSLGVEICIGSLFDVAALTRAFSDVKAAFHTAGGVSFKRCDWETVYRANVEGTAAVLKAVEAAKVERLVYTSSGAAIGFATDPDIPADESYSYDGDRLGYTYYQSKYLAEQKVLYACNKGIEATIVNPTVMLGRNDTRGITGRLLEAAARGYLRFAPPGGINIVDVEDAAKGHILAFKRGERGERYLLGGTNITYAELFKRLNFAVGRSSSVYTLPLGYTDKIGGLVDMFSDIFDFKTLFARDLISSAEFYMYYTHEKAQKMLGYSPLPLDETLRLAYEQHRENRVAERENE